MVNLRDYQEEAINNILKDWDSGVKSILLVQATGTGKTVVFSELTRILNERGKRVLILAHRDELLEQARDKLLNCSGVKSVLEKASIHSSGSDCLTTVGSNQTLRTRQRLNEYDPDYFDYIIIDEAHHALSSTYTNIRNHFSKAKVLGVTATPYRGDKQNLGKVFKKITYEYPLFAAIQDGYLCPIQAKLIPLDIDISQVKIHSGDYDKKSLSHALDPYLDAIADVMVQECKGHKTVVFLPLIDTSKRFKDILCSKGFKAEEVDGQTPNRKEILKDFEDGKIDVLCNAMLLTEGWDCPSVDCIINLRPTRSSTLYTQIVGRGTRIYPGKEALLLLDFLWLTTQHNLCRPANLVAETDEELDLINEALKDGEIKDLSLLEDEAKIECFVEEDDYEEESDTSDTQDERENTVIKFINSNKYKTKKTIDPIDYAQRFGLDDYEPTAPWEFEPASEEQLKTLKDFKVDPELVPNKGYACQLIRSLTSRSKSKLITFPQMSVLDSYGFNDLEKMSKDQAWTLCGMVINSHNNPGALFFKERDKWNARHGGNGLW